MNSKVYQIKPIYFLCDNTLGPKVGLGSLPSHTAPSSESNPETNGFVEVEEFRYTDSGHSNHPNLRRLPELG